MTALTGYTPLETIYGHKVVDTRVLISVTPPRRVAIEVETSEGLVFALMTKEHEIKRVPRRQTMWESISA